MVVVYYCIDCGLWFVVWFGYGCGNSLYISDFVGMCGCVGVLCLGGCGWWLGGGGV